MENRALMNAETAQYTWFGIKLLIPKDWRAHYTSGEIVAEDVHKQHFYVAQYEHPPFLMLIHQAGHYEQVVIKPYIYDYVAGAMGLLSNTKIEAIVPTLVNGCDAFYFALSGTDNGSQILFQQTVFVDRTGDLYSIALAGNDFSRNDMELLISSVSVASSSFHIS